MNTNTHDLLYSPFPLKIFLAVPPLPATPPPLAFLMISGIYPVLEPGLSCPRKGGVYAGPKPSKVIWSVNS